MMKYDPGLVSYSPHPYGLGQELGTRLYSLSSEANSPANIVFAMASELDLTKYSLILPSGNVVLSRLVSVHPDAAQGITSVTTVPCGRPAKCRISIYTREKYCSRFHDVHLNIEGSIETFPFGPIVVVASMVVGVSIWVDIKVGFAHVQHTWKTKRDR